MAQHLGRSRMSQHVGAFGRRLDAGSLHGAPHHTGYTVTTYEWPERSDVSDKEAVGVAYRRPAPDVVEDCVSDLLWERQPDLITSLPRDPQRAGPPLDIGNAKLCHVTGPQTKSGQEHDDCAIATTFG